MSTTVQRVANSSGGESTVQKFAELAARVLLAALFLISGLGKIGKYQATAAIMESAGIPGELLPIVIALEIVGALALIVGWKTRIVSFLWRASHCWRGWSFTAIRTIRKTRFTSSRTSRSWAGSCCSL